MYEVYQTGNQCDQPGIPISVLWSSRGSVGSKAKRTMQPRPRVMVDAQYTKKTTKETTKEARGLAGPFAGPKKKIGTSA